ncbi:ferritin-like domain-containing protein [uncultured Alistipes sp.]|jgi:ferritin-like metal-binding protein YciE|uniref:YciE/YciF ferroxidase family protein n=1 Tax=Alistipes sp. TaxID=1872444 RepID=UPI0025EE6022|nr:ferritin-like domain-containing protein [uncultured Alistipes sp.]
MNTKKNKNADSPRFREFFLDQIKDIYWAEKHLSAGLKKMKKAATSPELAAAFGKHIEETAGQIEGLKRVFALLGKTPQAKKCEAMEGLVAEAESVIEDTEKDSYTRDAGLILAAQKAEHYEIASYGTLQVFAEMMGEKEIARELGMILKQEEATDSLLSCLAEDGVNEMAVVE